MCVHTRKNKRKTKRFDENKKRHIAERRNEEIHYIIRVPARARALITSIYLRAHLEGERASIEIYNIGRAVKLPVVNCGALLPSQRCHGP